MKQEIKIILEVTLEADAKLSRKQLLNRLERGLIVSTDINCKGLEVVESCISSLKEEAEIYGNK